jgi:hypothetical protein
MGDEVEMIREYQEAQGGPSWILQLLMKGSWSVPEMHQRSPLPNQIGIKIRTKYLNVYLDLGETRWSIYTDLLVQGLKRGISSP